VATLKDSLSTKVICTMPARLRSSANGFVSKPLAWGSTFVSTSGAPHSGDWLACAVLVEWRTGGDQ
jgi:hypothetical protein